MSNSNTCLEHQARQIVAKVIGGFSKFFFHKNGHILRSNRQISLRSFQSEAFCMRILMVQARGLGKFCSSRTTKVKIGKMDQIFGKVISGELKLNFFGPAGGKRTRKGAFALKSEFTWLVETEIAFSVEQQYSSRTTSEPNCGKVIGAFSKFFSQKWRCLEIQSIDFAEKLPI